VNFERFCCRTEAFPPGVGDERVVVLHGSQQEEIEAAKNTDRSTLLVSVRAARRVRNGKDPADEAAERRDEPADAGEDGADLLLSVVTDEDGEEGEASREEDHTEMEIRESEVGSRGKTRSGVSVAGQLLSTIDEVASYVTAVCYNKISKFEEILNKMHKFDHICVKILNLNECVPGFLGAQSFDGRGEDSE
jgi:hypothetical protein